MDAYHKSFHAHAQSNIIKTWLLLGGFSLFILAVGYVLSVELQSTSIMLGAGVMAIGSSVWSYWFSDKLALKATKTQLVTRATHKDLYEMIDNLAITAGLPTPRIGIIDDQALNAFATGRNPEHGVVVFTTGLLEKLSTEELRGVAAHELSHIANRDILIGTIAVIFASIVTTAVRMMQMSSTGNRNERGFTQGIGLVVLFVAPFIALLLRMAVSRRREYLADASGAILTQNPEGLASALERIGKNPKAMRNANESTAHLFIANPSAGLKKIKGLLMTHPPIEDRVSRLRGGDAHGR